MAIVLTRAGITKAGRSFFNEGGGAMAAVSIILMLVVPLPHWALDVFLALNITLALGILMMTFYIKKSLEFSSFPSLLLLVTLFRLALNVSATRLILGTGHAGAEAARSGGRASSPRPLAGRCHASVRRAQRPTGRGRRSQDRVSFHYRRGGE